MNYTDNAGALSRRDQSHIEAVQEAITEAMSRMILAQDCLKRISGRMDVSAAHHLPDTLEATTLIAEAMGWLQNIRRQVR